MNTTSERTKALVRLLERPPAKRLSEAAAVVAQNRSLLRRAIRRGHSLATIAAELKLSKRTLQRHLHLSGLFFRKPRRNTGTVVRPYRHRKVAKE